MVQFKKKGRRSLFIFQSIIGISFLFGIGGQYLFDFQSWVFTMSLCFSVIIAFWLIKSYNRELVEVRIDIDIISFYRRDGKLYLKKKLSKIGFFDGKEYVIIGFIKGQELTYLKRIRLRKIKWGESSELLKNSLREEKVLESRGGKVKFDAAGEIAGIIEDVGFDLDFFD